PNSDDISMFQIDQASGALAEVPGSPFAVPALGLALMPPSNPISIVGEPSGGFLFVGYLNGTGTNTISAIVSLAIDVSGPSPVLRTVDGFFPRNQDGTPVRLLTDSTGLHLYVGLGPGHGVQTGGAEVYSIDSSGQLSFQGTASVSVLSFNNDYAI